MSEADAARFEALAAALIALDPALSGLEAALLAAAHLGLAADSRGFARRLGVSHALVLRALAGRAGDDDGLLRVVRRDERTLRAFFEPGPEGRRLLAAVEGGSPV